MRFLSTHHRIAVALAAAISFQPVCASLIDGGTFVTDTVSGLDWFKLSNTTGLSYNAVLTQVQTGSPLEGWSVASRDQVASLFQNAGVAPLVLTNGVQQTLNDQPSWLATRTLMDLLGVGYDSGGQSQAFTMTIGMFGPVHSHPPLLNNVVDVAALILYKPETYGGQYVHSYGITASNGTGGHNFARDASISTGTYLVRASQTQSVPEPSTAALVGLSLFTLVLSLPAVRMRTSSPHRTRFASSPLP